jgi:hypothetical protein
MGLGCSFRRRLHRVRELRPLHWARLAAEERRRRLRHCSALIRSSRTATEPSRWMSRAAPQARDPLLSSSPDHRGATPPLIAEGRIFLEYLGVGRLPSRPAPSVAADSASQTRMQVSRAPTARTPSTDVWVTDDDDAIFVQGGVGGYMQTVVRVGRAGALGWLRLRRHPQRFAVVDGRRVHYRTAGSGPPVELLARLSALLGAHLPLLKALSDAFTCDRLDTPGYGIPIRYRRSVRARRLLGGPGGDPGRPGGATRRTSYGFHTAPRSSSTSPCVSRSG